ncbi:MAG TPA: acetylglutamate kinase [Treponemataceae bacterium]|nr:acetylglutamate kinase [Treponemataceae bacterium]
MYKIKNEDWADVLVQALPYFKQFVGKVVVVKYGGNAMLNNELKAAVMQDIVLLNTIGIQVCIVHGGGPEINKMLGRVGKKSTFINGLRYTDKETMEIVQMVLAGKINKDIVGILQQQGGQAVGLCGVDSGLFTAKKIEKDGSSLGYVGQITTINPEILKSLLNKGFIPVIAPVALGEAGHTGTYNINADTAAAKLAVALEAEKFIQLTNVPGVMRNTDDPNSLIQRMHVDEVQSYIDDGIISGGMIPKIECCLEALKNGVSRAHIIDGRVSHALLIEMFSDRGVGTMVYN